MKVLDHLHFGISSSIKWKNLHFVTVPNKLGLWEGIFLTLTICGIMNSFFFFFSFFISEMDFWNMFLILELCRSMIGTLRIEGYSTFPWTVWPHITYC